QGVLLRILEEKRLLPLGGTSEVEVNVRLITATNKNLWKMAKEGTFREDLLFRLQEFTVTTVPLREMMED
ncbi:sigma 54-interacting transcriptional regulator, partial [Akkermansia muciniphila]